MRINPNDIFYLVFFISISSVMPPYINSPPQFSFFFLFFVKINLFAVNFYNMIRFFRLVNYFPFLFAPPPFPVLIFLVLDSIVTFCAFM